MRRVYIWVFLALLATYITLTFTLPTDPQVLSKYGFSQASARLLNLTIVIPLALIYLAALYGFVRVSEYADKVRGTKEGPHFKNLANGLMILAFSLPLNSIMGSLVSYVRHAQPHLLAEVTIVRQYLALFIAFTGIYFIWKGASGLFGTLKRKAVINPSFYGILGPVALASVYTWLIVSQGHYHPETQPYQLPAWVVVMTIAVPYVVAWCVGIWAAVHLYKYQNEVKGVIYRRAIDYLAKGIAGIILISVLLQFLTTLVGMLNRLDLTPLLTIIYILIGLYTVGYGLVARGAKKLKQIEEV